jgi:hypothetical protein
VLKEEETALVARISFAGASRREILEARRELKSLRVAA